MSSREWMGGAQTAGEKRREACVSLRPSGALVRAALVAALWVVASAGQARPTQGRHSIDRRVEHVLFLSRARGTQGLTASERARRISYRTPQKRRPVTNVAGGPVIMFARQNPNLGLNPANQDSQSQQAGVCASETTP